MSEPTVNKATCTQADSVTRILKLNYPTLSHFFQEQQGPSVNIRQPLYKRPVGSHCLSLPHLPNPNSISTPVFIQNAISLTVANYILIHEAHFIEESVWLVWQWVTAMHNATKQKWEMMKAVVCCSFFPIFSVILLEISRYTAISMMAPSCWNSLQTWFHPAFFSF